MQMWTECKHSNTQIKDWVQMMAEELNMNWETVQQILTEDLRMRKISAKVLPWTVTGQKEGQVKISLDLLKTAECLVGLSPMMNQWVSSMIWKQNARACSVKQRLYFAQRQHTCVILSWKPWMCTFFHHKGMVHYEFIEHDRMMNQVCYLKILRRLQEYDWRKGPELWPHKWILHLDNASAHYVFCVCKFLAQQPIPKCDQSLFPDLALCSYCLFPKTKGCFERKRSRHPACVPWQPLSVLEKWVPGMFPAVTQREKCIASQGDYFEGDNSIFYSSFWVLNYHALYLHNWANSHVTARNISCFINSG